MTYNRKNHVIQVADAVCEDIGYNSYKDLEAEDIECIAYEVQCNYQGVCEILNIPVPPELKPIGV